MNTRLRRLLGYLMVIAALIGVILSIIFGYRVWRSRPVITVMIVSNLTLARDMVVTTNDLLNIVNNTLSTASDELNILLESLLSLNNILQDSGILIDSLQDLTGNSLPETIQATQTSLSTAQQSAEIIDNLLRALSRIPFFPGDPYDPDVPLSESLNQISNSLDSIIPSMKDIQSNLSSTKENISQIDINLSNISKDAFKIQQNLSDAQNTVQKYQQHMDEIESRINTAVDSTPVWVNRIASGLIFVLLWLGFAQIGLLMQGINIILK